MELWRALGVRPGEVIALVGGGGKTHALYRLGSELVARGLPTLLCGTTRFTPPERGQPPALTIVPSVERLMRAIDAHLVGPAQPLTATTGRASKGRFQPLDPEWLAIVHARLPGMVIVAEADGSAMRPFKAPAAHEPVIPACTTLVVCCVGVDVLGQPLDAAHVHRPEHVATLTGATLGEPVTPEIIASVLVNAQGGHKALPPGARWIALLNKADRPDRLHAAERVAAALHQRGASSVIAALAQEPPVRSIH